jgi:hypothetical protein
MYDGADLSAVYGTPSYDQPMMQQNVAQQQPIPQPTQQPQQLSTPVTEANPYGKPTSTNMPSDATYTTPSSVKNTYTGGDTFWDKIGQKKPEVIKMFILSLVVVLGLSLDRLAGHYMTDYISKAILTNIQEFMVRLSYPVGVLLFLWIVKAIM